MRIGGLEEAVQEALAVGYDGPSSGRIRSVPDRRTIRYYTTLGLLDRPAAMEGRTALYGRRHLLQLVAIKRLQAEGLELAEIQARLTGLSDRALAAIARLPEDAQEKEQTDGTKTPARPFWRQQPAEPVAPEPNGAPPLLTGVPLAEEVTLLIRRDQPLGDADVAAIRAAAEPLLRLLGKGEP